jgi:nucleoside-diphosphate-sugar epimerase
MKIVITGATGAFGAAMVRYFSSQGHQIIAVGRIPNPPKELLNMASYLQHDICQPFELPEADLCIHGAALSDDKATDKQLYNPNVVGTKNTVEAAKNSKKFIFISSSSVYLPDSSPISEDMAGQQNNSQLSPYGKSKLASEKMFKETFVGEAGFILRPRAFYGPGDTQILPRMMNLVKNGVFNKPGPLEISLSMTHYLNIAKAIECCIASDLKGVNIYNVADQQVYTMIDTLRSLFKTIYKRELPEKQINIGILKVLAFFRIAGFTPLLVRALTQNMVLDISKIENELGYKSVTSLNESLKDIGQWIEQIGGAEELRKGHKEDIWKV